MAETATIDRPSVAKPVSRPRSAKPATVSVSGLALHLRQVSGLTLFLCDAVRASH
jgi:hypothetical protein